MAELTYEQMDELDYCIRQLQRIMDAQEYEVAEFGAVPLIAGGLCTNKVDIRNKTADLQGLIDELKNVRNAGRTLDGPRYVAPLGTVARICRP